MRVPTIPRPPTSTLFPYTTLFRSFPQPSRRINGSSKSECFIRLSRHWAKLMVTDQHDHPPSCSLLPCAIEAAGEGAVVQPDRKSTRLNSSHSQISYAVFCLKKKIS